MNTDNLHSTWIEVDLGAIENNVSLICQAADAQVMAVIKANAYGHGTIPVAQAAIRGGAKWLGVARIEEILQLRDAQIDCPILIMGYTPPDDLTKAIKNNISLTIWSGEQLTKISSSASALGMRAKTHLKVDTGMSRLGAAPEDVLALAEEISNTQNVDLEGIFTHFARADEEIQTSAQNQGLRFINVLDALAAIGIKPSFVHAANSAATLFQPNSRFNLVRPGIAIYGLHPSTDRRLSGDFQAALAWKAVLSQVKTLPAGRGISYGHEYVTQKDERVGTIPLGYADGFRRVGGNQVLVGGKQVPIIGRVCMDQVLVQLDSVPGAIEGDEVVIIGTQVDAHRTAEEVADSWGTINYEVVCGLAARVPRVYKDSAE